MRTTLLSLLALNTVVFAALAEPAGLWAAEPERLTESQMDAVTAGAVVVGMSATAIADFPTYTTYTSTNTSTTVISAPSNIVEIGLGSGQAVACCGPDTYTAVQSTYYAEGDHVIANSVNVNTTNPIFSKSFGRITVIEINTTSLLPSN
jgi:hypothetical protein